VDLCSRSRRKAGAPINERLVLSADHSTRFARWGPWSAPPKAVVRREACGKIRRGVDAKAADRQLLVARDART